RNLFSIGAAIKHGTTVNCENNLMKFYKGEQLMMIASKTTNNLFELKIRRPANQANVVVDLKLWHERLGHPILNRLRELEATNTVPGLKVPTNAELFCEPCQFGKMARKPFKAKERNTYKPGELFYCDVCG